MDTTLSKKRKSDATTTTTAAVPSAAVLRAVLNPLTKDQLIDIISANPSPSLLSAIRSASASDPARRKLFVRGLGPDTSSEALSAAFSPFGELEEAVAVADRVTGKLRGFGFVVFRYVDGALTALERPSKRIDGRMTVAQIAADGNGNAAADVAARKVYVGNIPAEVSADRLLSMFMGYGEVEEGPLGFDNQGGKPRRFAFFIYKSEEGARACLADPMKTIDGTQVVCKLAVDGKKGGKPFGPNDGDFGNVPNIFPPGPGFVNPGLGPGPVSYQKPFVNQAVPPRGGGPGYPPVPFYDQGFAGGGPRFHGPGSNEFGGNAGPMFGVPPGGYSEGGNYGPGYAESGNYGPGYPSQMNQPPSGPRGPHPGGMYPGVAPPFF